MWTPPPDQVTSDNGWRPPGDQATPQDNQRWDQKAADFLQPVSDAADKIQASMPYVAGLMAPTLGLGYKAAENINQAAGAVAQPVTEFAGQHGVPGPLAAIAGMGASVAANPMSYVDPGAGFAGKVMEPVVPAERAFDVGTAQKYGLPMTRADLTGDIGSARIETGLSKSITGGPLFQDIAKQKLAAIDAAKSQISSRFGTEEPPSAIGAGGQSVQRQFFKTANQTAEGLYKQIPNDVIPHPNIEQALNQVDFKTIDPSAHPVINDIRAKLGKSAFQTEATTPEPFGPPSETPAKPGEGAITRPSQSQYRVGPKSPDLPVVENNPVTTGEPYAVYQGNYDFGEGNQPSTYILRGQHPRSGGNFTGQQLGEMGIPVRGQLQKAVGQTPDYTGQAASPVAATQFQTLNEVRNRLSREIQSDTSYNPIAGNQVGPKGQALIPLKKALDQDLKDYVSTNQDNPLGKMRSEDFLQKFDAANKFYGAYKSIQNNKFVQKLSKAPASDFADTLFGTKNIEDVNMAKKVLGDQGFNAVKQQFFNKMLESKNIQNTLGKYTPEYLNAVFNSDELNALKEAHSLKQTSLTAEKLAGNPSGTGQMVGALGTLGLLGDSIRRFATDPSLRGAGTAALEAGVTLGVPYAASKAYLASTHGIPYSMGAGSLQAAKIAGTASSSARKDLHDEFVRRYIKIK